MRVVLFFCFEGGLLGSVFKCCDGRLLELIENWVSCITFDTPHSSTNSKPLSILNHNCLASHFPIFRPPPLESSARRCQAKWVGKFTADDNQAIEQSVAKWLVVVTRSGI